jgi:hypothetical protein
LVTKTEDEIMQVEVENMMQIRLNDNYKMVKEQMIIAEAVKTYMRKEKNEYGKMYIIMNIEIEI